LRFQILKFDFANPVCNTVSGAHYTRARIKGKLIWKSLKADTLSAAKLRLGYFLEHENKRAEFFSGLEVI